ncbi:MAG: S24/S26 family peptidase [Bacteroidaceae bacterium]|nr:S24/S26 family peptidase [Bacteroidaceae bacterium]
MAPFRRHKRKRYATADDNTPRLELPNDKFLPLVREAVAGGEKAVISVKGFSMRPFLEHLRDKVELAPWTQLHVGDAVLAEIAPGHYVLHRIIAIDGQHLTLMGDGNIRGTERCRMADVCGVVDAYIRPNGHVMLASDPKLQRRIRLWRRLLPLRRYLLFIYKHSI